MSSSRPVDVGVPQGSILGPLLFILYVNDFHLSVDVHMTMYADDTSLLVSANDPVEYQERVDDAARAVASWFGCNGLFLNANKTRHLLFHTRQRVNHPSVSVAIAGETIERCFTAPFLGILFDSNLTFNEHCAALVKKINSKCYQMRNLRTVLDIGGLMGCYHASVHSILSYGILVWGSSPSVREVFLAQKRVIRCCARVGSRHSCRDLFRTFGVLPLPCVYIRELVSYVYQRRSDFGERGSVHSYATRQRNALIVPFRHIRLTSRTPDCMGVQLYNLLPGNCKEAASLKAFRHRVKELLLELCCYTVDEYVQARSLIPSCLPARLL